VALTKREKEKRRKAADRANRAKDKQFTSSAVKVSGMAKPGKRKKGWRVKPEKRTYLSGNVTQAMVSQALAADSDAVLYGYVKGQVAVGKLLVYRQESD
jgi:hypothetical protein